MVRHADRRWYFAGDFGDSTADGDPIRMAGFLTLRRWMEAPRRIHDREAFFYRVYAPMMEEILDQSAPER